LGRSIEEGNEANIHRLGGRGTPLSHSLLAGEEPTVERSEKKMSLVRK